MIARGFRASLRGGAISSLALVALTTGCTSVPLTAPTKSTIALYASASPDGSLMLTATVTEEAGTPVQNGTLVTFTTTLGHLDPTSARTTNGQASVKFLSDGLSGTATVSAFSGGATSGGTGDTAGSAAATLTIPLGGAAVDNVIVHAEPSGVSLNGGTVKIVAQVRDASGNGLPNVLVAFSTTAGSLSSSSVSTDGTGTATTNLTTTSKATVTATAGGSGKNATVDVNVAALPTITLSASPASPVAGQPVTFTIGVDATNAANPVRNVRIDFGDGDFEDLGVVTGSTTAAHVYDDEGNQSVTVTVTDSAGQQARQVLALVVSPSAPIPVTVSPSTAQKGVPVTFTATATASSGVAIESYDWSFGDGTSKTTTGNQTSKVYGAAGTFHLKVTAHATDGSTGVAAIDVLVTP